MWMKTPLPKPIRINPKPSKAKSTTGVPNMPDDGPGQRPTGKSEAAQIFTDDDMLRSKLSTLHHCALQ